MRGLYNSPSWGQHPKKSLQLTFERTTANQKPTTHLWEDNSQWEADSPPEPTVAHDDLLLDLDLVDPAQVDQGGEEEGAQEPVDEAQHNRGQDEPSVKVVRLLKREIEFVLK